MDSDAALAVARGIKAVDAKLIFLAPAGSAMVLAGRSLNLVVAEEMFADRNYDDYGNLVPRSHPRAMVDDSAEAATNVLRMLKHGTLRSISGREIPCRAHSVCVHGDTVGAVALARSLKSDLSSLGIEIASLVSMV